MPTYVEDLSGVHHRFDRFLAYHQDENDNIAAHYVDGDGTMKETVIDLVDWQDAITESAPMVPCNPGHFVITFETEKDGRLVVHKDAVLAWRRQGGYMLPCTCNWRNDDRADAGYYPFVLFPDGHVETVVGRWPNLQALLDIWYVDGVPLGGPELRRKRWRDYVAEQKQRGTSDDEDGGPTLH